MEACKKYLRNQCQLQMCYLEHSAPQDFCVSCWQRSRSRLPLMIIRIILFLLALTIMVSSMTFWLTTYTAHFGMWFIYMTHWGVILLVITTGFSAAISIITYFKRLILENSLCLPWYVKTYWVLYNTSIPIALLITLFYWTLLYSSSALEAIEYAPNPVLDVAVHAINSVLMLVELSVAAHPSRLAHFNHCFIFGLVYLLFGVIYYLAGGVDPRGNPFIYPVIDWSRPGPTTLVVLATALFLLLLHVIVVAMAAGRDALARRVRRDDLARRPGEDARLRSENAAA